MGQMAGLDDDDMIEMRFDEAVKRMNDMPRFQSAPPCGGDPASVYPLGLHEKSRSYARTHPE